jgi:plasmid stabilization system protein ParE
LIADFIAADNPARAVSFIDELLALCTRICTGAETTSLRASGKPSTAVT